MKKQESIYKKNNDEKDINYTKTLRLAKINKMW